MTYNLSLHSIRPTPRLLFSVRLSRCTTAVRTWFQRNGLQHANNSEVIGLIPGSLFSAEVPLRDHRQPLAL